MDKKPSLLERYTDLMSGNTRGVQIGCYSVAFIGLTIAMRRVRPFSRFKKPSDVPKRFVRERRELTGVVERLEGSDALLMVNHKPLLWFPFVKQGQLPVKIANIRVTSNGVSWLQTIVAGNEVTFVPASKEKNFVECEVKMVQKTHDNKTRTIDLGESLVSIGFGALIEKPIRKTDPSYPYYMRLKSAEELALKKKMGIKYYVKPTMLVMELVARKLNSALSLALNRLTKQAHKTPKLAAA